MMPKLLPMNKAAFLALGLLLPLSAHAFDTDARQMIAMDAKSATVLMQKSADERMYPASMTKLMTIYLLFKEMKAGNVSLDDGFVVSERAWRMGGSKMFVELGKEVNVEDLIRGIIIQSGNDACVVVAEALAGSEEAFAERMTDQAKALGMHNTNFTNSTGWPDENLYTTAHDIAILSQHLIDDFPEYYHYFAEPEFTYHGIRQYNRNLLIGRGYGVDGLKTGHTEISGFGIAVSATKNDERLIVVVHGLDSMKTRAEAAAAVLQHAFANFRAFKPTEAVVAEVALWHGAADSVPVRIAPDAALTLPTHGKITSILQVEEPVAAPITQGQVLGTIRVEAEGMSPQTASVIAAQDVAEAGFFGRMVQNIKQLVR